MNQIGLVALAAAVCMGAAVIGGACSQGRMAAAALEGIARNPGIDAQGSKTAAAVRGPLVLALSMTESLVLFAMVVSFTLIAKIG